MDEKRTKTLEALATFIDSQKALLHRTQSDIERLKGLRQEIAGLRKNDQRGIGGKLAPDSFRLSNVPGLAHPIEREVYWSLYKRCDPAPFQDLAARARNTYAAGRQPPTTQQSALSPLQVLVKDYRSHVLDPVLASMPLPSDSEPEDRAPDPEELRRARERAKIHELKRRRVAGGASTPVVAGLGLRPRASNSHSVFVRRDQEDESAEVDVSLESLRSAAAGAEALMEVDTPPTSVSLASPASAVSGLPSSGSGYMDRPSRARERRPTKKAQEIAGAAVAPSKERIVAQAKTKPKAEPDAPALPEPSMTIAPKSKGMGKGRPKSETYKQAWSVSEQHLLERLLEEIPEGEKNRWSKISRAMNGRRTARQVASRVQKYYEKLKRFGLDVGGSTQNAE